MSMSTEDLDKAVAARVKKYMEMRSKPYSIDMYEESMWQFAEMAHGGRGFDGNRTYIRDEYYSGYPNEFFFQVLSQLGEFERYLKVAGEHIGIP